MEFTWLMVDKNSQFWEINTLLWVDLIFPSEWRMVSHSPLNHTLDYATDILQVPTPTLDPNSLRGSSLKVQQIQFGVENMKDTLLHI